MATNASEMNYSITTRKIGTMRTTTSRTQSTTVWTPMTTLTHCTSTIAWRITTCTEPARIVSQSLSILLTFLAQFLSAFHLISMSSMCAVVVSLWLDPLRSLLLQLPPVRFPFPLLPLQPRAVPGAPLHEGHGKTWKTCATPRRTRVRTLTPFSTPPQNVLEDGSGVAIDWVTGRSYSSARRRLNVQSRQREGRKVCCGPLSERCRPLPWRLKRCCGKRMGSVELVVVRPHADGKVIAPGCALKPSRSPEDHKCLFTKAKHSTLEIKHFLKERGDPLLIMTVWFFRANGETRYGKTRWWDECNPSMFIWRQEEFQRWTGTWANQETRYHAWRGYCVR